MSRTTSNPRTWTLRVNGRERRVAAAGDTPLLWVLRDGLGSAPALRSARERLGGLTRSRG